LERGIFLSQACSTDPQDTFNNRCAARRYGGFHCNAAIADALPRLKQSGCLQPCCEAKPIVANPSCAAYTWVSVGVEVLISRLPSRLKSELLP
jgi:hypothetical protein